jgi:hypothetical protein
MSLALGVHWQGVLVELAWEGGEERGGAMCVDMDLRIDVFGWLFETRAVYAMCVGSTRQRSQRSSRNHMRAALMQGTI